MSEKVKEKEEKKEVGNENTKAKVSEEIEEAGEKLARRNRKISELEEKLSRREGELESHIDRIKHLQADFENYRKRVRKEERAKEERIEDRFIRDIIPIYDNLARAFRSFRHNNDKESFIEGIEKIFSQFDSLLTDIGVEPIQAEEERFDPKKHEALISVESKGKPNMVLEEFERGYQRHGRVLKPSRVKVSKQKIRDDKEDFDQDKESGEEG